VVAIFIPIAPRAAAKTGTAPARFPMPVSYAALLSGTLTLVAAAPNPIVDDAPIRHGAQGLDSFSLTPVGSSGAGHFVASDRAFWDHPRPPRPIARALDIPRSPP
jgi:hypothetical protein